MREQLPPVYLGEAASPVGHLGRSITEDKRPQVHLYAAVRADAAQDNPTASPAFALRRDMWLAPLWAARTYSIGEPADTRNWIGAIFPFSPIVRLCIAPDGEEGPNQYPLERPLKNRVPHRRNQCIAQKRMFVNSDFNFAPRCGCGNRFPVGRHDKGSGPHLPDFWRPAGKTLRGMNENIHFQNG